MESMNFNTFYSFELSLLNSIYSFRRYQKIKETFKRKYGCDPEFYARAPGRVNIIGEHIDYCGYGVLPMAVEQDIVIAVGKNESKMLKLCNTYNSFQ